MTAKTELLTTMEKIRAERFPDIPKDVVEAIIDIETDLAEEPVEAYKRVAAAIEEHLTSHKEA